MGINHRSLQVFVAEEFLDCPDVVSLLDEVGGKAVPEGVDGGLLVDACFECGIFERPLQ